MPINLLVFAYCYIGYLDALTWKINLWGNQSILGCLYCTIECCMLLVKLALAERALHRCCRGQGFKSCTSLNFFRLSFCNCKRCVYNCNDLLSYYSSHITLIYHKSSIKDPLFRGRKLIRHPSLLTPLPSLIYSSLINDRLY